MVPLRIGTRGSRLALWQATYVADCLRPLIGGRPVELVVIQTAGDQVRDVPLPQMGGLGVFTKEIQRALLGDHVDVAVHSLKDLPTSAAEGTVLAAIPPRGPVGDAFVSRRVAAFDLLPPGAVLATSSLRRRAQALNRRLDLQVVNIRGNVETRLRKLVEENLDGLILAQAGLERLGLEDAITERLDTSWMMPAAGQGALALECRAGDNDLLALVGRLDDPPTHQAILAERAFLRALGGGCQVPIGIATSIRESQLAVCGSVLRPDGSQRISALQEGSLASAEALGIALAEKLLALGAKELLAPVAMQ